MASYAITGGRPVAEEALSILQPKALAFAMDAQEVVLICFLLLRWQQEALQQQDQDLR